MIIIYALVITLTTPSSYGVKSTDYYQSFDQCIGMLKKYKRMNFKSKLDETVTYKIGSSQIDISCQLSVKTDDKEVIMDK